MLTNADRSEALQHYNEKKNRFQAIVPSKNWRGGSGVLVGVAVPMQYCEWCVSGCGCSQAVL